MDRAEIDGLVIVVLQIFQPAAKIINMNFRSLLCMGLLSVATGCFYDTQAYSLYVKNSLSTPVSVCTTKYHGPSEAGWESPEDLADLSRSASDNRPPGVVIPPGKTVTNHNLIGTFDSRTGQAMLRVYAGTPNLSQMNAISRGSINRLDLPLYPGWNGFVVETSEKGYMTAKRLDAPPQGVQP
jgi:hypothetical protein